jgi:DhnA family fructose-bisphosphate aldolase class Ia
MGAGHAVVVAFDHGLFRGPVEGMANLPALLEKINPSIDAVSLSPGMLRHCWAMFSRPKQPLAVVRLNWTTIHRPGGAAEEAFLTAATCCEPAAGLREGMDLALVALSLAGEPQQDTAAVENFARLVSASHELGIPVIGEYVPAGHEELDDDRKREAVAAGSRIAAELGADVVKTHYTPRFEEVCSACPVPVLAVSAEKMPTQQESLELARRAIDSGAGGVVFGRNALQVPVPFTFQAALCDVVKGEMSVARALKEYSLD